MSSNKWPSGTIQDANWQTSSGNVPGDSDARGEMLANLALIQQMLDAVDGNAEVLTDLNSANIAFTNAVNTFISGQIFSDIELRSLSTINSEIRMRTPGGSLVQSADIIKFRQASGGNALGLNVINRNQLGQDVSRLRLLDDGTAELTSLGPNGTTNVASIQITPAGDIFITTTGFAFYNGSEIATLADI